MMLSPAPKEKKAAILDFFLSLKKFVEGTGGGEGGKRGAIPGYLSSENGEENGEDGDGVL